MSVQDVIDAREALEEAIMNAYAVRNPEKFHMVRDKLRGFIKSFHIEGFQMGDKTALNLIDEKCRSHPLCPNCYRAIMNELEALK